MRVIGYCVAFRAIYTGDMDRARLGRVLGTGARQAAKTLMSAAEAVAAPDPSPRQQAAAAPITQTAARSVAEAVRRAPSAAQVRTQAGRAGRSVWSPVARFSSVLWLEVTGAFFAIFAAFSGTAAWRLRGVLLAPHGTASPDDIHRFWIYFAVFAGFAYFAVSSFARARKRQRR